jgi:hypothetical protein
VKADSTELRAIPARAPPKAGRAASELAVAPSRDNAAGASPADATELPSVQPASAIVQHAGPVRDRMLYVFGLPGTFDKKRLWKRVKKLNGASDLSFPVVLPGNAHCPVASLLFTSRPQRQKAAKRLGGHSLLGHKLMVCGAEQLLARKEAFTKVSSIVPHCSEEWLAHLNSPGCVHDAGPPYCSQSAL